MKKIKIKGKDYVMVHERIKAFRKDYEGWSVNTEWLDINLKYAICKVSIIDNNGATRATGTAMELQGEGFINKFSHIENCETSAVGRALGFMGIGVDESIASYDEVANAVKKQDSGKKNKSERKRATSKKFVPEKSKDIARQRIKKGFDFLEFDKDKRQDWIDEHIPVGLYDATIDDLNELLKALEKEAKGKK